MSIANITAHVLPSESTARRESTALQMAQGQFSSRPDKQRTHRTTLRTEMTLPPAEKCMIGNAATVI
jgi:hypothetical protein